MCGLIGKGSGEEIIRATGIGARNIVGSEELVGGCGG